MIREIWREHKLAVGMMAGIVLLAGVGFMQIEQGALSGEKMQALNSALENGLITQHEYEAKLKALKSGAGATRARETAAHGSGQMKTVEIMDPFFGLRAATLTIPADWKFEGTVLRGKDGAGPEPVFRASSPDGLTGVQRLPRYEWQWSEDPRYLKALQAAGAKAMKPLSAEEFIKTIVIPEGRPGAQVGQVEPIPDVSERIAEQERRANEMFAANKVSGMASTRVVNSAQRVHIAYEFNGHAEEEWLAAITSSQQSPGIRFMAAHSTSQGWISGARAPKGQLNQSDKLLRRILTSLTPDPEWSRKQQALDAKLNQRLIAQMQQQNQQFQARQNAIFQNSMNSAAAMSAASHQSAMATAEHMGDVQSMIDPVTGRTGQVSNQYNYSYANQDGRVIHTNSSSFNPNAQLRGNWTQLQPIKPQ